MKNLNAFVNPILARISGAMRIHRAINMATMVTDDPTIGTKVIRALIAEKAILVRTIRDEDNGEDIVFVGKPKQEFSILREVDDWTPDAMLSAWQCKVLNTMQKVRYTIHPKVLKFVEDNRSHWQFKIGDRTADKITTMMKAIGEYKAKYPDMEFVQKWATTDNRRYYALMNPVTHQGGDVARGLTWFARKSKVRSKESMMRIISAIKDEYGVSKENYELILKDPSLAFGTEHGLKGKKPVCAYAAAVAIDEMVKTGRTGYIVQQDQTCSGFQHWSMELECAMLALLTNLSGGKKQDLYTEAANCAKFFYHGEYVYWFDRQTGKFMVMRLGYGAAAKSLSRGLILAKPQDDDYVYMNEDGVYIPESLDKIEISRLNETHLDHFRSVGWAEGVAQANKVSKAYYNGLMTLSPKLQAALKMSKIANENALKMGEFLSWELPNGDVKQNMAWAPDPKAEKVRIQMKDHNGRKFQFSFMPMIRMANGSAVAPIMIHSLDGFVMGDIVIVSSEDYGEPIAGIHDSVGTTVSHFDEIKPMWIRTCEKYILNRERSVFFDTMLKYGVPFPKKLWPNGWKPIDISKAQYHLG